MARLRRIACFIAAPVAAWATLGVLPAAAQFFNPFEALFGPPPRPPSSVPSGRPQQGYPQYPDQRYPDQRYPDQRYPEQQQYPDQPYPGQARQAPPGGVQSQPLPPPDGAAAAVDPLPGQRQPRGTPQPADTAPQPGDDVVAEPPSQKIANKSAMFSGLDKITGRIIAFDAAIGETVQFGALQVTPRICYTARRPRPPTPTPSSRSTRSRCRATSSASSPAGCSQPARACMRSSTRSMTSGSRTAKIRWSPRPRRPSRRPQRRHRRRSPPRHRRSGEAASRRRRSLRPSPPPRGADFIHTREDRSAVNRASTCAPETGPLVPSAAKSPSPVSAASSSL